MAGTIAFVMLCLGCTFKINVVYGTRPRIVFRCVQKGTVETDPELYNAVVSGGGHSEVAPGCITSVFAGSGRNDTYVFNRHSTILLSLTHSCVVVCCFCYRYVCVCVFFAEEIQRRHASIEFTLRRTQSPSPIQRLSRFIHTVRDSLHGLTQRQSRLVAAAAGESGKPEWMTGSGILLWWPSKEVMGDRGRAVGCWNAGAPRTLCRMLPRY